MAVKKEETKTTKTNTSVKEEKTIKASKPKALVEKEEAKTKTQKKIVYHVSKREDDKTGREWKVFIEGSSKVIKIFKTQKEALDYALSLRKDKETAIKLHGLDGKIRSY